jgi:hypothetical protein
MAVIALGPGAGSASAAVTCTASWDGGGDNSHWSDAGNWDHTNTLPTSTSVVCLPGTGTVIFDSSVAVANRTIATLDGAKTLELDSPSAELDITSGISNSTEGQISNLVFNGGNLGGTATHGKLKVSAMTILATAQINGPVLDIVGPTTWTSGGVLLGGDVTINNGGVWTINDANPADSISCCFNSGFQEVFHNLAAGTITKASTGQTAIAGMKFENDGTVNVNAGELIVGASGGGTNGGTADLGTYHVSSGKTLTFHAGTRTISGATSISAAGATVHFDNSSTLTVNGSYTAGTTSQEGANATLNGSISTGSISVTAGGTLNVNSDVTGLAGATPITLTSGQLGGSGDITMPAGSTFSWTAGKLGSGAGGTLTIPATGTLSIDTTTFVSTDSKNIANHGTVTWTKGQISIGGGAHIDNSGTWNDQTSVDTPLSCCFNSGGLELFHNLASGTYTKANTSKTNLNVPFTNDGTLNVNAGTVAIDFFGLTNYDNTSHQLTGGTYSVKTSSALQIRNADIQTIGAGASLTLDGASSLVQDTAGSPQDGLRQLTALASGGALTIKNSRDLTVPGALSDAGVLTVGSGSHLATGSNGSHLNVSSGGVLQGTGTLASSMPVFNSGTVKPGLGDDALGTLTLSGGFTQQAGGHLHADANGHANGQYDVLAVAGAPTVAGSLDVLSQNGYAPVLGDAIVPVTTTGLPAGTFSPVSWTGIPAGTKASATYHTGDVTVTVVNAPQVDTPAMTKPAGTFQNKSVKFTVAWTSVTGAHYNVKEKSAPASSGTFGALHQIKTGLSTTSFNLTGTQGTTYCFEGQATKGGQSSAFSTLRCTAVPFDDRALTRNGNWQAKKLFGYYLNTFLVTKTHGDTLSIAGVHAKKVAAEATVCPTCGSISVAFGGTTKTFSLVAGTTKREQLFVVDVGTMHTGTVTIKVTSSGKQVQIDALGASAV